MHLSVDKLLPCVYPKVDCWLAFIDSGAPGRGCVYSSPDEQDDHHPLFHYHGWRPNVHRWPDHIDNSRWWPHGHGFRRKPDPTLGGRGGDPNHIDYGHLRPNNIVDHADNSPSTSLLEGETNRQLRPARSHRSCRSRALRGFWSGEFNLRPYHQDGATWLSWTHSANSCHYTRMAGNVSGDHGHHRGMDRSDEGNPSEQQFSSRPM